VWGAKLASDLQIAGSWSAHGILAASFRATAVRSWQRGTCTQIAVLLAHERACRSGRAAVRHGQPGRPFFFVKAMLGLDAHDGVIDLDPRVPGRSAASTSTVSTPSAPTGTSKRPAKTGASASHHELSAGVTAGQPEVEKRGWKRRSTH
jgi:hypothetical protein